MKIGFIGLGKMGSAIAENILKAGASRHFTHGIDNGMGEKDWSAIADIIATKAGL